MFPTRECGEHCMQRACIHTTSSECNISDLVILLRGWNFASGSMAVASSIVTPCLLIKHNSIAMVSMCGVQFWMISWLVLSSWKVILQERPTSDFRFLQEELPRLLEDVPLNKRGRIYFQHDEAPPPHSSCEVRNFLNYRFPGQWIGRGITHSRPARSPDLSPLDYCVWGWRTGLQCKGGNVRWIAWSHFGCRRPHQKQSAEAAMSYSRSSQPSGSLCCSRRWHFRKPALSTDQFKLKVISRS